MTGPYEGVNHPGVRKIARRIAANGGQQFEDDAGLAEAYGREAVEVFGAGRLGPALHELGYTMAPLRLTGEGWCASWADGAALEQAIQVI